MNTPARYEAAKFADIPSSVTSTIEKVLSSGDGLYIHGPVGTGKTHIAFALKNHFESIPAFEGAGYNGWVVVWNVSSLLNEIKADFSRDEKRHAEEQLCNESHLVILDDIGAEKPTEFVIETLYRIINARYEKKFPTIFTSNLTLGELADRIGDRAASRITEMCTPIKLEGDDRRFEGLAERTIKVNV